MTYKGFQKKKKTPIYQFPLLVSAVPAISSPHVCAVPVTVSLVQYLPLVVPMYVQFQLQFHWWGCQEKRKRKKRAKLRHLILLSRVTY
jgi:hypothetical protein